MYDSIFTPICLVVIYGIGCAACYAVGRWHERQRGAQRPEPPFVSETRPHVESMRQIAQRLARFKTSLSE